MYQEFPSNSQVEVGDYSDKTENPSEAKDCVTFYAANSSEPVTLYPEASDQYFASHQNDNILRNLGEHQVPLVPAPAEPQMESILNRNEYKISLRTSSGREEVCLMGNKPLFMKTIKSEVMNFLNNFQVPIATFCERILNKSETSSFSAFLATDNWDLLRNEERMTYYKLSQWITEPATKRMFDLIQKEPDVTRKNKMTKSYVEMTTVPRSTSTLSLDLPDVEITPVSAYRNVESVGAGVLSPTTSAPPTVSLAPRTVPVIARTVTTVEERLRIKQWSLQNPEATARQRSDLAQQMGVTKGTVDRIINYEKRVRGSKEDPKAKKGSQTEHMKQQTNPPGPIIAEPSKDILVGNREERIKTAIQEAVKTGALKVDDLKKSFKIVVKTRIADNQYEQEVQTKHSDQSSRTPPRSVDLKYNRIALESYFKSKPNPTPEEINHFVSCTKVPKDVTLAYLSQRKQQSPADDINNINTGSNPVVKQEELSPLPLNAESTPGGIVPKLTEEQKVWFDHFLLRNPAPDMQAIIEFSKTTGMPFETVALILECWNFEDQQASPSSEWEEILGNLAPDTANLLRDIHRFTVEDFPPALEEELRTMFGRKIFLTLENIKSFAVENNYQFQDLYKTLTSSVDHVQLVSEETCRRLMAVEEGGEESQESQGSPAPSNNWLTNSELMFEQSDEEEESQANPGKERGERDEENMKRKSPQRHCYPSKKLRADEEDDSGYLTPDDVSNNSDLLSNIIMENIGEVNMLNDSLDLFNESIQNIDLLNEMYEKVEDQDRSELIDHLKPKTDERSKDFESLLKEALEGLHNEENQEKTTVKEQEDEDMSDLRKIFHGPFQNFQPIFQVINIKESSINNKLFEVELSNGKESSRNFYFKSRASELQINQKIKLKQLRYVGSRICVETFQVLDLPPCDEKPTLIEESFFRKIRSAKVESFELCEVETPKTIMEYICLEENLKTFMERNGFYPEDQMEKSKKLEILFKLCQAKVNLSSKILKLLSKFLKIEKEEIEKFFIEYLSKIENSPQMLKQDHCYVSMYDCFI